MKKTAQRIKENITKLEYRKLTDSVRGSQSLRANSKSNLLRTFTILYYTGLRINEVQELRVKNIRELIQTSTTKLFLPKTQTERKLYLSKEFKKELTALFDLTKEDDLNRVITKGSNKNKRTGLHQICYIQTINDTMKNILGSGYTSHSFRQGLITEMGSKGINTKIISKFINHRDVKTTMRYINPTDEDIQNCMIR